MAPSPDIQWIIAAAFAGGIAGRLSRIPGGPLLGATALAAVTHNAMHLSTQVPHWLMLVLQVILGAMLGQSFNRRFWEDLLAIWRPAFLVVIGFTLAAIPFTLALVFITGLDPLTAALAATPGRIQDVIVLAGATGRDGVTVMLLHFARQICIIVTTPLILAGYAKRTRESGAQKASGLLSTSDRTKHWCARCLSCGLLLGPAAVGAPLGELTGHPLGPLLGAFLAVAVTRILSLRAGEAPFPRPLGVAVQCLAGVLLGVCVTPDIGRLLLSRLLPFCLSIVYILGAGLLIARVLQKRHGWSKELSWMSAAPGRTSDMLAISQDLAMSGRDRLALVTAHTVRQIAFTLLISLVTALF